MTDQRADDWLRHWADGHVQGTHPHAKADVREAARACVDDGQAAGFTIADLKAAANGDVERYLLAAAETAGGDDGAVAGR